MCAVPRELPGPVRRLAGLRAALMLVASVVLIAVVLVQ